MRRRNGQEGVAMITIMMIVVVLTLPMVATLNYAMQGEPQSRRDQDWNAALVAAQAGVDDYLYRLQQDDEYVQYSATNPPTPANAAFTGWLDIPGPANDDRLPLQRADPDRAQRQRHHDRDQPIHHLLDLRRLRGDQLGTITVSGVIAQKWRGPVGTSGGTGYLKGYGDDSRMQYASPPYVQEITETDYRTSQWAEVTNPSGLPA